MRLLSPPLNPTSKTRIAAGMLMVVLVALGATAPYWLLPHSSHLEGLAALVQIVFWGGAGVLALIQVWGLRRRPAGLLLLDLYVPLKARVDTPEGGTWERVHVAIAPEE